MNKHTQSSEELPMSAVESQPKQNSSEIYTTTDIEGSPFKIIETETETFLILGRYKITRGHPHRPYNKQEYIDLVNKKDWNLIIDVISICTEMH